MRNAYGAPDWEDDGTVIAELTGPNTAELFDQLLSGGRFYYYAIFVREVATGQWHRAAVASGLTVRHHDTGGTFFRWVPGWFQEQDAELGYDRAHQTAPGPLERFLRVIGMPADFVRTEYDSLRWTRNPDRISGNLLPLLAEQFGVPLEPAIGMRRTRFWTRDAVFLYRRKGTLPGIKSIVTTITGWDAVVAYGWNLLRGVDAAAWFVGGDGAIVDDPAASDFETGDIVTDITGVAWEVLSADSGPTAKYFALPTEEGTFHHGSAEFFANPGIDVAAQLWWLDADGVFISDISSVTAIPVDAWTSATVSGVAPAGAAYVALVFEGTGPASMRRGVLGEGTPAVGWSPPMSLDISVIPVRSNFVRNPSFETGLSSWSIDAGTIERREDLGVYAGSAAMHVLAADPGAIVTGGPYEIDNDLIRHTASLRTRSETPRIRVRWIDDGLAELETTPWRNVAATADEDGWYLLESSSIPPAGAIAGLIDVEVVVGDMIDAAMLEEADAAGDYFDGSFFGADYIWNANAHSSASRYYPGRSVRNNRLRELLPDWLPVGQMFNILYVGDARYFGPSADEGALGAGALGTIPLGQ